MTFYSKNKGELLALLANLLWGLFPVIINPGLNHFPPYATAGLACLFSLIPLFSVLAYKGKLSDLSNRDAYPFIAGSALFVGVLYYGIVFFGVRLTSPANASALLLCEIPITTFILRKSEGKHLTRNELLGGLVLFLGAVGLVINKKSGFAYADLILIGACIFPPFGNMSTKKARRFVSSEAILFLRNLFCGIFFVGVSLGFEEIHSGLIGRNDLILLAVNGIFLMGLSKIFFIESMTTLPIPKVIMFLALTPMFTTIFSLLFLGLVPTLLQGVCIIVIMAGLKILFMPGNRAAS